METNRYSVACSAQTNSCTEAGDPGAHDDDIHGFSLLCTAVTIQ